MRLLGLVGVLEVVLWAVVHDIITSFEEVEMGRSLKYWYWIWNWNEGTIIRDLNAVDTNQT